MQKIEYSIHKISIESIVVIKNPGIQTNNIRIYHNPCQVKDCPNASKINGTPNSVYLLILKLHSILAVANLLAHNNRSQILLQSTAVFLTIWHLWGNIYFAADGTTNVSALAQQSLKNTLSHFQILQYFILLT